MSNDTTGRPPSSLQVVPGQPNLTPTPIPDDQVVPEIPAAAKSEADVLERQFARRMEAVDTRWSPRLDSMRAQLESTNEVWDDIQASEQRQPRYSSAWFYWPFMFALAVAEVPINRFSFELFFQESPAVALLVSFLVGGLLVSLAHRLGMLMCRFGYNAKRKNWWGEAAQIVLVIALVVALAYGVSILRQGYLAFITQPDIGFGQALESQQFGGAAIIALKAGLGLDGWIFLLINLAVVAVGVSAAYFCHDQHPDFERVDRQKRKLEKQASQMRAKRADEEAVEKRRFANQMRRLGA
ncbi:MAG: hypothetical protein RH946_11110 [Rhodospirillales bacterium]|tara:strand:- start:6930 stop:7820 length:891 start_codon:yes stop_codon:yes gene_type:complete